MRTVHPPRAHDGYLPCTHTFDSLVVCLRVTLIINGDWNICRRQNGYSTVLYPKKLLYPPKKKQKKNKFLARPLIA